MAKKRDVIIAVIIGFTFLCMIAFFALIVIGMLSGTGEVDFAGLGGNVGVVDMYGVIDETSGRVLIDQLERWQDNDGIKAVVIHVNSPGGGVAISQEIYDAILRLRDQKPVVVAMASVAASGGYYISCAADRIMANPGTLTGSIGVIFQFLTFEGLMDKVGVAQETIKSGELKDVGSYSRAMTHDEELMLRSVIMDTYEQFVAVVATGRDMEKDEVYPLADGSVFTGLQAFNLGLVDTLGGLKEAVDLAGELAGLSGEPKVVKPYKREKVNVFDLLGNILGEIKDKVRQNPMEPGLLYLYQ